MFLTQKNKLQLSFFICKFLIPELLEEKIFLQTGAGRDLFVVVLSSFDDLTREGIGGRG
jgi:hypothetical protein